jgi:hypothetical protein
LPPGRLSDLYHMYLSVCSKMQENAASLTSFKRCWRSKWEKLLRFRKINTHTMCSLCHRLRSAIRGSRNLQDHMRHVEQLWLHLAKQWEDRSVYWGLRQRSRTSRDVLALICDSMDRAKFVVPRWGRTPKAADKLSRPVLEVTAVLAHGYGAFMYIGDEVMSTGSSWALECVFQAIDEVLAHCQVHSRAFPDALHAQADNTSKELKNSACGLTLGMLTACGYFQTAAHGHLQVGHTHEDVDALFGLIAQLLKDSGEQLQTPQDFCRLLNHRLVPLFKLRGETFKAIHVPMCRPWRALIPRVSRLTNCYVNRPTSNQTVPHVFSFLTRACAYPGCVQLILLRCCAFTQGHHDRQ